jgi:hypothetical protein
MPPYAGYRVKIPVVSYSADGAETIVSWLDVVEPIDAANDPFSVTATVPSGLSGVVALRINYPFQSASMSGFQPRSDPLADPSPEDPAIPIEADDTGLGGAAGAVSSDFEYGPYAGTHGLGRQAAWAKDVRPFRRVIAAQAIYRREVFQ